MMTTKLINKSNTQAKNAKKGDVCFTPTTPSKIKTAINAQLYSFYTSFKAIILFFFSIAFSLNVHAQEVSLDRIAALVNNDVVMLSEVRNLASRIKQSGSSLSNNDLIKDALEKIILEKVQLQRAKELGIKIDNTALNQALLGIAKQNKLNLEQFRVALGREGIDYKQFRNSIRDRLYVDSLRKRQQGRNQKITESEIDDLIQSESINLNQNVQYHIVDILIPAKNGLSVPQFNKSLIRAQSLRKKIIGRNDITVQKLLTNVGATKKDLGWKDATALTPTYLRALSLIGEGELTTIIRDSNGFHILKLVEQRGGKRKITKQARVRHILIAKTVPNARIKAVQLRNKILAGENFAKLAKENSADTGSASDGGNLGFTDPASFVPPFAAAVNTLPLNSLSQPIQTRFGWHIIEVLERKVTDQTREALKLQAQSLITDKKNSQEYKNWLQGIRDEAFVEYRI